MKRLLILVSIIFIALTAYTQERSEVLYADPTIYSEDGKYYLIGTRNRLPFGFKLLVSEDLKTWKDTGVMPICKGKNVFGQKGFWAPQIIKESDKYYITYTANEQTVIAESNSLVSNFYQKEIAPIDKSEKNIDSYLFKDDNGKYYLYHVRFNKGNYIWVAEFDIVNKTIKKETLKKGFDCTEAWEKTSKYKSAPIMEGPTVIKIDGTYYLFYSANHFKSIDYAVGYATSSSPLGPWQKNNNSPIIHRSIVGENGSGHGDIFIDSNGDYNYVYHVHNSDSLVEPRRTRIVPLQVKKNKNGVCDIKVDSNRIIRPYLLK